MLKFTLPPEIEARVRSAHEGIAVHAEAAASTTLEYSRRLAKTAALRWTWAWNAARSWRPKESERYTAVAIVLLLHVLVIWGLATSLRYVRLGDQVSDMQVTVVSPSLARTQSARSAINPELLAPQAALVSAPDIQIAEQSQPANAITGIDMRHLLPPRPDPSHINSPPRLPVEFRRLGGSVSAVLKIFVQPDGSISEAQVMRTSGDRALDAIAVAYVEKNWRLVAALASGRPVPDWTTVLVPFRTA
jgi:TonB-like protein